VSVIPTERPDGLHVPGEAPLVVFGSLQHHRQVAEGVVVDEQRETVRPDLSLADVFGNRMCQPRFSPSADSLRASPIPAPVSVKTVASGKSG
jgi:hypothetical protein